MAEEQAIQLWQTVAPLEFVPHISDRGEAQALLIATRQGIGFQVAGGQLAHAVQSRATQMLLDYSQHACSIRYLIDGNWEQLPPIDRETGDAMLYALKQLCLMNPADRRSPQSGKLTLKLGKNKLDLSVQSQGVPTGERVLARIDPQKLPFERLSDLGMRDKMIENYKQALDTEGNLVLITAPKGEGLTTSWVISINAADRLIRDFQSIEHQDRPEPDIININPNYYAGDTGLTALQLLGKIILKEPDVLMYPEPPEPDVMELSLDQLEKTQKQIYTRLVANSAVAGFSQLVHQYPGDAERIAKLTGAVVCQKLARRLCDNCKLGFEPPPQLLQQLAIPAGRVAVLYQPFIPPPIEQQVDEQGRPAPIIPCHVCGGRGYFGRIAIFELLIPGEQLRAAVTKTQDLSHLSQIAKAEGHRGLQSEAVLTVARGLTSLDELKRVFAR